MSQRISPSRPDPEIARRLASLEAELARTRQDLCEVKGLRPESIPPSSGTISQQNELSAGRANRRLPSGIPGAVLLVGMGALLASVVTSPRLEAQENARALTVRAPFVVLDSNGKPLFRVNDEGGKRAAVLFNDSGVIVANLSVKDGNGIIAARTATAQGGNTPGDSLGTGAGGIFTDSKGNVAFQLSRADGKNWLTLTQDEGLTINNASGNVAAQVGFGKIGGGRLSICNSGGNAQVEAGVLQDGRGIVRVYPLSTKSPIPIPTFLRGATAK